MKKKLTTNPLAAAIIVILAWCGAVVPIGAANAQGAPPNCTAPAVSCGGACVNTQTSNAHCGACDNACPTGNICRAGDCVARPTCSPSLRDCRRIRPGFYSSHRVAGSATTECTDPGFTANTVNCGEAWQPITDCNGPPIITQNPNGTWSIRCGSGGEVRISCGPRRVHRRLVTECRSDLGAIDNPDTNGPPCVAAPMAGYNTQVVRLSVATVDGRLRERFRDPVDHNADHEVYGSIAWPTGTPAPAIDNNLASRMNTFLEGREARDRNVDNQLDAVRSRLTAIENRPAPAQQTPAAPPPTTGVRVRAEVSLGVMGHWSVNSLNTVGGGALIQGGLSLRWSQSIAVRFFGGWGMGAQSETPYLVPNGMGGLVDRRPPLHLGVVGMGLVLGSGPVTVLTGLDGSLMSRPSKAMTLGSIASQVNWHVGAHIGARVQLVGPTNNMEEGFRLSLDALVNPGFGQVAAIKDGLFFNPLGFDLQGSVLITSSY